jgi:hypothetical protein
MRDSTPRARAVFLAPAALAAALAPGSAGCSGGDKAPDCKAVGAAYASLQQREIEKPYPAAPPPGAPAATAEQKEQALSLIPLLKEAMVKECEDKKWGGQTRRCVVEARTPDDLERCRTRAELAPPEAPATDQGGDPDRPGEGPGMAPAPGKSDSP